MSESLGSGDQHRVLSKMGLEMRYREPIVTTAHRAHRLWVETRWVTNFLTFVLAELASNVHPRLAQACGERSSCASKHWLEQVCLCCRVNGSTTMKKMTWRQERLLRPRCAGKLASPCEIGRTCWLSFFWLEVGRGRADCAFPAVRSPLNDQMIMSGCHRLSVCGVSASTTVSTHNSLTYLQPEALHSKSV